MAELKGDIDYTVEGDQVIFRANTPKGEEYLEGPEFAVPTTDAKEFIHEARTAGIEIISFF
ncbi:hypothetical protein [Bradyrhizobium sp. cf659]|uniref:hypothetical protein n=1 Tax=Bradyrhizobium sp. cf659 TaxID=1761771 RepID=UPI0008E1BC71|nr:hypothetical protein [Bradyrhizobium sp. cf659]SFJ72469.1 hypothetical protein SAMN04487925_110229 [Bradyrhizobium sp. cf659]